ncbi:lipoprotein [Sphingomonas sp. ID0503]|uniref:lipoprotein n=1 Tax=Sphingomonas sp. ID0503 TaxID=3399691 RepID=UPI003AFA32E3
MRLLATAAATSVLLLVTACGQKGDDPMMTNNTSADIVETPNGATDMDNGMGSMGTESMGNTGGNDTVTSSGGSLTGDTATSGPSPAMVDAQSPSAGGSGAATTQGSGGQQH